MTDAPVTAGSGSVSGTSSDPAAGRSTAPGTPGGADPPTEPFRPAALAGGPQAQTLLAYVLRRPRPPTLRRERLDTPDGDFLDVDWLDAPPGRPHVLVLHGLEGSPRAGYVRATLRATADRGWGAVAMAWRGCSGEPNRALRSYCSGETEDPRRVLAHVRARGVTGPLLGVGFSLGANALLKLLAEDGHAAELHAAAAISAPFDLAACAAALDGRGPGALYRRVFLRTLRRKATEKLRAHPDAGIDVDRLRAVRTLRAFDDAFTAPTNGYRDAADYYARASSGPLLSRIRRPVLCISAEDDPMIPGASLPLPGTGAPYVRHLRTARGGHVGFLAGSLLRPRFWAEREALAFLASVTPG